MSPAARQEKAADTKIQCRHGQQRIANGSENIHQGVSTVPGQYVTPDSTSNASYAPVLV
jgi:hypothetical protein